MVYDLNEVSIILNTIKGDTKRTFVHIRLVAQQVSQLEQPVAPPSVLEPNGGIPVGVLGCRSSTPSNHEGIHTKLWERGV